MLYRNVFIASTGRYMPGEPVDNESMDQFIKPLNNQSARIKRRILAENGIQTRHYAINSQGETWISSAKMAAAAVSGALQKIDLTLPQLDFLASATTGPDQVAPGFANQIQGELKAPPLETLSVQGICAASMGALKAAAQAVELGGAKYAAVVGSELPSRLFKSTRFQRVKDQVDFDSHFLRWMLSDGAGSVVLSSRPRPLEGKNPGVALQLKWLHLKSFSGDFPYCMRIGSSPDEVEKTYLDFDSLADAEANGAYFLRQDIRLLPNLFDLGMSEMVKLVQEGRVNPNEVDHFLCHYSSEKFKGVIRELLDKAQLTIPADRWYSNLTWRGNTGSASIFIMLDEFLETHELKPGAKILCFVPESGRFTVSFMMLEAVAVTGVETVDDQDQSPAEVLLPLADPEVPELARTLRALNQVWHEYRSRAFRSPIAQKIFAGQLKTNDYLNWMENWIPQVRAGSVWMREAVDHLPDRLKAVGEIINVHAGEEQFDFKILYNDYRALGGVRELDELRRNPGGEALNAFMMGVAKSEESYSLLGGTFIIEGTGQRIIPTLLPRMKAALGSGAASFRFLEYHGENDIRHMQRWLDCMTLALAADPTAGERIVATARAVAELYALQWEYIRV